MKIPIHDLKEFSKKYKLSHIIVFAFGKDNIQYMASYGDTTEACSQAADFSNKLKTAAGWPESLHAQPSTVKKLKDRILELEAELDKYSDIEEYNEQFED